MNDDNKNKEKEDFHEQEVTKEVEKIDLWERKLPGVHF